MQSLGLLYYILDKTIISHFSILFQILKLRDNSVLCFTRIVQHRSQTLNYSQFHQHFTRAIFVQNFGAKNLKLKCSALKLFGKRISAKNPPVKSWWNWHLVDPTKLFFFANEEFFCFSLVSLHFCYKQKKNIDSKMT